VLPGVEAGDDRNSTRLLVVAPSSGRTPIWLPSSCASLLGHDLRIGWLGRLHPDNPLLHDEQDRVDVCP
jgi:hypothetical protein